MQNLIRGGSVTGGGGEFSQAPWTSSQYFERELGGEFNEIIPRPDQPIKFWIFNSGSEPVTLSLGEGKVESPWIIVPGDLFEEEILESLHAKGNTSVKILVRSRSQQDSPSPINPLLFLPVSSQTQTCQGGSFLWAITPPSEPTPLSVDFSLVESWWWRLIQIRGYSSDNFFSLNNDKELWISSPYGGDSDEPTDEPSEDTRFVLLPTETALYIGITGWDILGGSVEPVCAEWIQETKSFRILSETSFI